MVVGCFRHLSIVNTGMTVAGVHVPSIQPTVVSTSTMETVTRADAPTADFAAATASSAAAATLPPTVATVPSAATLAVVELPSRGLYTAQVFFSCLDASKYCLKACRACLCRVIMRAWY